jgi:hypothetical protein
MACELFSSDTSKHALNEEKFQVFIEVFSKLPLPLSC